MVYESSKWSEYTGFDDDEANGSMKKERTDYFPMVVARSL
jgi:hypothetical protein